jgi:hypothetical protein
MNTVSSRESRLTVTRRSPAAASAAALPASSAPLVVSDVLHPVDPGQHRDQPVQVAAQQRLAAGQPQPAHAQAGKDPAEPGQLLEGQQVRAGQEREIPAEELARHAIGAAELAAVGDRDPQIPQRPRQRVRQRQLGDRHHAPQGPDPGAGPPGGPPPPAARTPAGGMPRLPPPRSG